MKPRIGMITLGVRDLKRAVAFYQALGLPRLAVEGTEEDVAFFDLQGTWLGLFGWEALAEDAHVAPEGSGFRGVTLAYMGADAEEVDAVLAEAAAAGGRIVKPGQKVFWGGYSGYFEDPDGHLWEVAFNPFFWPGPKDEA
ncbi:MAG: glyoxalase [Alphaproteobacteria bacterium CG_4_10_14_0_2_um_filter_63_37]|nr:MAG: glyoxalase [Proteobacteria bacterium CG1_02_64_396]PJA24096.1 MAG: glyoxalase [Alphaproteobacteria bacterium CG_4_10_14_0_2_um_filter_63_37]